MSHGGRHTKGRASTWTALSRVSIMLYMRMSVAEGPSWCSSRWACSVSAACRSAASCRISAAGSLGSPPSASSSYEGAYVRRLLIRLCSR